MIIDNILFFFSTLIFAESLNMEEVLFDLQLLFCEKNHCTYGYIYILLCYYPYHCFDPWSSSSYMGCCVYSFNNYPTQCCRDSKVNKINNSSPWHVLLLSVVWSNRPHRFNLPLGLDVLFISNFDYFSWFLFCSFSCVDHSIYWFSGSCLRM